MKFDDIKDKITDLKLIGKGWRGKVYRGIYQGKDLAFKVASDLAYSFIEGKPLNEVIDEKNGKILITKLLKQARKLDKLGINKEEFHRPYKNVLVDKDLNVYLIDFERSKKGKNIQNVNQLLQFILSEGYRYLPSFDKSRLIELAKEYKKNKTEKNFKKILSLLGLED